jgi:plasmid maintenance system antidote protein VapI
MSTKSAMKTLEKMIGPITFGMLLRSYMEREEITQTELAKVLGTTLGYVSNIINDRKKVSLSKAIEIAEILGEPERTYLEVAIEDSLRESGVKCSVELKNFRIGA